MYKSVSAMKVKLSRTTTENLVKNPLTPVDIAVSGLNIYQVNRTSIVYTVYIFGQE